MEVYFMGKYEFSLRQEVLLEKGASVLGDLFRFKRQHGITDRRPHLSFVWLGVVCKTGDPDLGNRD